MKAGRDMVEEDGDGSFVLLPDRSIDRLEFGDAMIDGRFDGGSLILAGPKGRIVIPAGSVDRLRHDHVLPDVRAWPALRRDFGFIRGHCTTIYWGGRPNPVVLRPYRNQPAFLAVVDGLATAVQAAHPDGRLYIGGGTGAVMYLAWVWLLSLLLLAFLGFLALRHLPLSLFWAVPVCCAWLAMAVHLTRKNAPRPVALERLREELIAG